MATSRATLCLRIGSISRRSQPTIPHRLSTALLTSASTAQSTSRAIHSKPTPSPRYPSSAPLSASSDHSITSSVARPQFPFQTPSTTRPLTIKYDAQFDPRRNPLLRPRMASPSFLQAVQARRTQYQLGAENPIGDERLEEILRTTVQAVPSSFNAQSTRYVALLKEEHKKFWGIVAECLEPHIKEDTRERTEGRLKMFREAYGTILFYEDPDPVDTLKRNVPQYAEHMGRWSEQTNAMNQFAVWTALDAEGLGCNLQHYNPLIDQRVAAEWKVPETWALRAQLVFGKKTAEQPLEPKPKNPVEEKLFVHGK